MEPDEPITLPGSRWARLALLVAFWVGASAVFVGHAYVVTLFREADYRLSMAVFAIVTGLVWIPITPLVARLVRRFPIEAHVWGRRILLHLGVSILLNLAGGALAAGLSFLTAAPDPANPTTFEKTYVSSLLNTFLLYQLIYAAILAVVHAQRYLRNAVEYLQKYRERDLRTATLEAQLAQAQLRALRMQLNPHFLFNTLHAISSLMTQDVRGARRMTADLSELLRLSLDRAGENEVTLHDELHFLRQYLSIEETRFQDRMLVETEIEPDTLDALIPNLLLQPLVENAIKHGIAPFDAGGTVRIASRRCEEDLEVVVEDTGPGMKPGGGPIERQGIGLRNTRERLAQLYGDASDLALTNLEEGGFRVTVRIPFHTPHATEVPAWSTTPSAY